jgi:hypothetical protein
MAQAEVLLRLRYAIDTAIKYPTQINTDAAIRFASDHPRSLRSGHIRANLGVRRWKWLNERGFYPVGEPVEVAGVVGIKGTITPDITT